MKLNDYVVKSSLEEVAHSSGYAKAQSGSRIGVASTQSFSQRQSIDYRNLKVRSYQDSQLGQLRMAQKIKMENSISSLDRIRAKREENMGYFHSNSNRQKNALSNNQIDRATKMQMGEKFNGVSQSGMAGFHSGMGSQTQSVVRSFQPSIRPKF